MPAFFMLVAGCRHGQSFDDFIYPPRSLQAGYCRSKKTGYFDEPNPGLPQPMSTIRRIDDEQARGLLLRVGNGCQTSFETLYRMLSRRVFAFVCRSIDNPEVAREIMMDTMYEIWNSAGRYRGEARVSTWVLGIARNKLLMSIRSRREAAHEDIDDLAEVIEDERHSVFDEVADKETSAMLAVCIEKLSPAHRECLHLLHFEDMSVAEIAELLNIPDGTVKSRLAYARTNLLRCVKATMGSRHGYHEHGTAN